MITQNDFKNDLTKGKIAENILKSLLESQNILDIKMNDCNDIQELKGWDIRYTTATNKSVKIEVKNDLKSSQTGNVAIEIICSGKPSGITTTKSNYWAIMVNDVFYLVKTKDLKLLIAGNNYTLLNIYNCTAWVYIVPIDDIKTISKKVQIPNSLLVNLTIKEKRTETNH